MGVSNYYELECANVNDFLDFYPTLEAKLLCVGYYSRRYLVRHAAQHITH